MREDRDTNYTKKLTERKINKKHNIVQLVIQNKSSLTFLEIFDNQSEEKCVQMRIHFLKNVNCVFIYFVEFYFEQRFFPLKNVKN